MRIDAERVLDDIEHLNESQGPLFKLQNDPRVTRVGRVLRKLSLDELPQLVNVVLGHMSLVGPRPPLPREVAAYTRAERRRLLVKPGLTGLWQVGGRSDARLGGGGAARHPVRGVVVAAAGHPDPGQDAASRRPRNRGVLTAPRLGRCADGQDRYVRWITDRTQ